MRFTRALSGLLKAMDIVVFEKVCSGLGVSSDNFVAQLFRYFDRNYDDAFESVDYSTNAHSTLTIDIDRYLSVGVRVEEDKKGYWFTYGIEGEAGDISFNKSSEFKDVLNYLLAAMDYDNNGEWVETHLLDDEFKNAGHMEYKKVSNHSKYMQYLNAKFKSGKPEQMAGASLAVSASCLSDDDNLDMDLLKVLSDDNIYNYSINVARDLSLNYLFELRSLISRVGWASSSKLDISKSKANLKKNKVLYVFKNGISVGFHSVDGGSFYKFNAVILLNGEESEDLSRDLLGSKKGFFIDYLQAAELLSEVSKIKKNAYSILVEDYNWSDDRITEYIIGKLEDRLSLESF